MHRESLDQAIAGHHTLKNINRLNLSASFLLVVLFAGLFFSRNVVAGTEHNVYGFGWSGMKSGEEIGWISLNNTATTDAAGVAVPGGGGNVSYGVNIDDGNGNSGYRNLRGYAWAAVNSGEGLGWISFENNDVAGCQGGGNRPRVSVTPDANNHYQLSGWARVLSAKNEPLNSGGWDGCISLSGTAQNGIDKYGVYIDNQGNFHGFAWTDVVIGWINFNSTDCNGTNCLAGDYPYKVYTTARFAPVAKIGCGSSNCVGGWCDPESPTAWRLFTPTGKCSDCFFDFANESTGDVECSKWALVDPATGGEKYSYTDHNKLTSANKKINLGAFGSNIKGGIYNLRLTVSASSDCLSHPNTAEHAVDIRKELKANFEFTFDDPYSTSTVANWLPNDDGKFIKKLLNGGKVYLRDDSVASDFAGAITSRVWKINGFVTAPDAKGYVGFTVLKTNTIRLDAYDNNEYYYSGSNAADPHRHNCIEETGKSKSLPEWKEVSPVGMIWNYFVAEISKIFAIQ